MKSLDMLLEVTGNTFTEANSIEIIQLLETPEVFHLCLFDKDEQVYKIIAVDKEGNKIKNDVYDIEFTFQDFENESIDMELHEWITMKFLDYVYCDIL